MSKSKTFLGIILFSVFMLSCTQKQEVVFPTETELLADSVPMQSIYDRRFMNVYGNYLVVTSAQSDTMIHVYKTPELKLISEFGQRGHAANEIESFPTLGASITDTIYVRGFKRNFLTKILMVNGKADMIDHIKLKFRNTPNDICLISDSTLCFKDIEEHCINLYDFNKQEIIETQKTGNGRFDENDIVDLDLGCLSSNGKFIIYGYQYKKQIKVFDAINLTPIKTINFPMQKEISSSQLSNIEDITLHYTGSTATVNGFYALYRGAAPSDDTSCCSIEFFDNNCNAKCRYKLDRKIFAFAVDEKNGFIYGCNDNPNYIYRYKFK